MISVRFNSGCVFRAVLVVMCFLGWQGSVHYSQAVPNYANALTPRIRTYVVRLDG